MNAILSETPRPETTFESLLEAELLDNVYDPVVAWNLDGSIVYWGQAAEEFYGFSREKARGAVIGDLLQVTYPIPFIEIVQQLRQHGLWSGEFAYTTNEGVRMSIQSHLKLLTLSNQRLLILQSDRDMSIHKQAEIAMRQVFEELENRVAERTQQLAAANKELESFSYSVSHDLRAPLRSLEGFARILSIDYPGKILDERALDLLRRITGSVHRMGQLIEDLLKLSQFSRTALHPKPVDISAMASAILDDLKARDPQRNVRIAVASNIHAVADPGLLHAVLENLIGNAWKFTGKTEFAEIEVGVTETSGQPVTYFVRDNGAGFNMEFANQLFAPFQRLHRASEFEGTGVGLATVQRIIHRHAGKIWAESRPGCGAKFLFTLGTQTAATKGIG